jgi:pimeloyl-ACP methyl ester carboxylesterase
MIFKKMHGFGFAACRWPLDLEYPTLIFIHGSGGDHTLWQGQVDALVDVANTLALDLPGHGASSGSGGADIPELAEGVAELLERLQVPRAIPCGLSIGGAIVLQLLIDRSALLAGGVLVGTGARLRVLPDIIEMIETEYESFVNMVGQFGASEKTDPERLRPVRQAAAACAPAVTAGDFRACDRFDVMDRLDRIDKPVLVVSAEDDRLTPPKYSDYLEKHIHDCQRVHIQDAGHLAPIEKPTELNQALRAFILSLSDRK